MNVHLVGTEACSEGSRETTHSCLHSSHKNHLSTSKTIAVGHLNNIRGVQWTNFILKSVHLNFKPKMPNLTPPDFMLSKLGSPITRSLVLSRHHFYSQLYAEKIEPQNKIGQNSLYLFELKQRRVNFRVRKSFLREVSHV